MKNVTLCNEDHSYSTYSFIRDADGLGSWYCISGKTPGTVGTYHSSNIAVPLVFGKDLTEIAVLRGVGTYDDFSREIKKEKVVSDRKKLKEINEASGGTKVKVKATKLSGFNPFAMSAK